MEIISFSYFNDVICSYKKDYVDRIRNLLGTGTNNFYETTIKNLDCDAIDNIGVIVENFDLNEKFTLELFKHLLRLFQSLWEFDDYNNLYLLTEPCGIDYSFHIDGDVICIIRDGSIIAEYNISHNLL